jgi:hypothetical protein
MRGGLLRKTCDGVCCCGCCGWPWSRSRRVVIAGQSRIVTALVTRAALSGDVNLQRRHGAILASGFALEYSVHALDARLWLQ